MIALKRLKSGDPQFAAQLKALLAFEGAQDAAVDAIVAGILADVKERGDAAVLEYTRRFDRVQAPAVAQLEFTRDEMQSALAGITPAAPTMKSRLRNRGAIPTTTAPAWASR